MTLDPGTHGLWAETAPPAPETPPLAGAAEADAVIVGGGYAGLSAALHLSGAGRRVVLLEARGIGAGGAGRNAGLVNAGLWVTPGRVRATLGEARGRRLLDLLGAGPALVFDLVARHAIACEAVRAGTLHCAAGAAGLADLRVRAAEWQALGAPVRLLGREETAARIGSAAHPGALLDERAGTIQPLAYARGLARAAVAAGARIHAGTPALRLEGSGPPWRVATPCGAVTAPWVILATDAYAEALHPELATTQIRLPYFNVATDPLPPAWRARILPGGEGAWDNAAILSSFRTDAAGRLVFGSIGALRGPGRAIHRAWSARRLAGLFPGLGRPAFRHAWWGWIGMTADAMPRFHRPAPGLLAVSGYNGRGIAPGTVFGRLLARLVLGEIEEGEIPLPVTVPEAPPLRRLRAAFYEAGAALAHLAGARG